MRFAFSFLAADRAGSQPLHRPTVKACLLPKEVSCSPERVKPVAGIPGRMPAFQSFAAGGTMKKFITISCLASIFCLAPVLGNAKEASPFCARQSESTG